MTISPFDEWAAVADRFGVDMEQVRRDHLISHLLGAIAAHASTDDVVVFGSTAFSRTCLTDARLSEDLDLVDAGALDALARSGPQARPPAVWMFETTPDGAGWRRSLGHRTRLPVAATEALDSVREAWRLAPSA
jgi:hypothetical protein